MCTSLTLQADSGNNFLARTMDFGFSLNGKPTVIPRNYKWQSVFSKDQKTKYGCVGTGRKIDEYVLADGVNEKGLAIAELYYPNEASYSSIPAPNKLNFAPHEFILWVLGEIESINELRLRLSEVSIVSSEIKLLGIVPPLHFIITDKTGETVVIETNNQQLNLINNPVGVMTNSPDLNWHIKNLNNYLNLSPTNTPNKKVNGLNFHPFGQGSGTFGLPGGLTPPERFVRTAYMKEYIDKSGSNNEVLNNIFHILNNVTIPKGINMKDDGSVDYTQYRAAFDLNNKVYYFNDYSNQTVYSVSLTEELVNATEPTQYDFKNIFTATNLNE
ncbi:choloylglycine hydrolase family protein [Enterococcus sp. ALS3]|uniref:Choloylglycine hydrolase family protein n=1 Tax=Enterococcus alishanensis TaxID=1303817 RepID=A0ABS6THN9_9ENTE|nr:choloylglycine hydrolase family protein [Enterococcus alishanensis]MBV7392289.1 choloylglycine hydrolase family protein [Enterococcus alishanensis]